MIGEFYDEILRRAVRFHLFTLRQCLQQASLGQTAKQNFIEIRNTYCKMCALDKISSRSSRQDARSNVNLIKLSKFDL